MNKDRQKKRKALLRRLILKILSGNFNNYDEVSIAELFNQNSSSRPTYYSPLDRSSYNYGYMTMGEVGAGTPNVR